MRQLPEALKVSSILMHGDMNDALEDGKDVIMRLLPLFVLEELVPEGVGQEVQADVLCGPLKQSRLRG